MSAESGFREGARPLGVTIIGVLQLIGGIVRILSATTLLGLAGLGLAGGASQEQGVVVILIGAVALITGLAYFYLGWSMLALRRWAWVATLLLNLFAIVVVGTEIVVDGFDWPVAVSLVIPVVIVLYLYSEPVLWTFGR